MLDEANLYEMHIDVAWQFPIKIIQANNPLSPRLLNFA